jgi:exonuclease SbcD
MRDIARDHKVSAIIHTGDVWDREPDPDTFAYGWYWLQVLGEIAPLVVLSGNHDNPNLFHMMHVVNAGRVNAQFLWPRRLLNQREKSLVVIPTETGERLVIAGIPYIDKAAFARRLLGEQGPTQSSSRITIRFADLMGEVIQQVDEWLASAVDPKTDVSVFAAHVHTDHAEPSSSERPFTIEEDFAVRTTSRHASYVAYGHIHKPQRVPGSLVGEYAGSPIPVDFGELRDVKRVVVVDAVPGRKARIESIPLDIGRRMEKVSGTIETLRQQAPGLRGALVQVKLELSHPIERAEDQVREALSGATVCGRIKFVYQNAPAAATTSIEAESPLEELFDHFVASRSDVAEPLRVRRYFDEVYAIAKDRVDPTDSEFPDLTSI